MTTIHGLGYIVQGVLDLPIDMLKSIECQWVTMVWHDDLSPAQVDQMVAHYKPFGQSLMVCGSLEKARIAYFRYGTQGVVPIPFNEPDLKDFQYVGPEELGVIEKWLSTRGYKFGGPNVSDLVSSKSYYDRWLKEGSHPTLLVNHLYGRTPAEMLKGEIISEWGSVPRVFGQDRVDFALAALKSGKPICLYQAVNVDDAGFIENANYTKPWFLNKEGQMLAGAIKQLSNPTPSPIVN